MHVTLYRITGNVCCDFIFVKVKKRENLTTCKFHNTCISYCACSVCEKIKSRKNLKLKNFATQTFMVIWYTVQYNYTHYSSTDCVYAHPF